MDNLALPIGISAGGVFLYNEYQKNHKPETKPAEGLEEQADIASEGSGIFSQTLRTLAYRILRETYATVTDFDALTDADLRGLMNTLGISRNAPS